MERGTPETKDLTFVSTADLIGELSKRHDALVVTGIRFEEQNRYTVIRRHTGNRFVLLGLLSNVQALLNQLENDNLRYSAENNA